MATPTPPQTAGKSIAATAAGLVVGGLTAFLAGKGLDLGPETTNALTVIVGSLAAGIAAYVKRNYLA